MATSHSTVCKFCLKGDVKYTCPRCTCRYCSTDCYKCEAHAECSENFYKECFMEGLKDMKETEAGKQKIAEILKRAHTEKEDDCDADDLAERLEGLDFDCDTSVMWSKLTASEKAEFEAMIKDGRMGALIQQWQPWWTHRVKIVEIENQQDTRNANVPMNLCEIKDIRELLKSKEPAINLKYNVVNILFGYAYLCRFYNGETLENSSEYVKDLYLLCGSFQASVYQSCGAAVQACLISVQDNATLTVSTSFGLMILRDTIEILCGPMANSVDYITAALSDLHRIFNVAYRHVNEQMDQVKGREKAELKRMKQSYFACEKKLEFLLSWTVSYGHEVHQCAEELEVLFCEMSSELKTQHLAAEIVEKMTLKKKENTSKKKLIEELN